MEIILYFLTEYFSDPRHVLFWSLVAIAVLLEALIQHRKNRTRLKTWLKKHNIGKKYWP